MDSIDRRMQSFAEWYGEVPRDAKRLEDFEAREHAATWVRRTIGKGIAGAYVIGFQRGDAWWSYFFERLDENTALGTVESWRVEAYDSRGRSWSDDYVWWPVESRWTRTIATAPKLARQMKS